MDSLIFIFAITYIMLSVSGSDYKIESNYNALENGNLFEGDILDNHSADRGTIKSSKRKWPNGNVPYVIDSKLKKFEPLIKSAMEHIVNSTCINFVERKNEQQYVNIIRGNGCYSHVGRTSGAQPLSLGFRCYKFGVIVHELMHAIGFFHEHSRADRDEYLDVHYENIQPGMEFQFIKMNPQQHMLLTSFDYNSIMLYGETYLSRDKLENLKTLTAKDGRRLEDVQNKSGMSDSDVERINKLYEC